MDFVVENLKEVLEAINKMIENNSNIVTTKKIRQINNIHSSNHSKINFIWRTLKYLEKTGILEEYSSTRLKSYKIRTKRKVDIEKFISQIGDKITRKGRILTLNH